MIFILDMKIDHHQSEVDGTLTNILQIYQMHIEN